MVRAISDCLDRKDPLREAYLKSRKQGISTFWLLYYLDDTIFNPNTATGILAHKWESLRHLWEIVEIAWQHFPDNMRPKVTSDSKSELAFGALNSRIFVSLSIRSISLHNLHISEFCFCDEDELTATLAAVSRGTNVTLESTANGLGNKGYELYTGAERGENGFRAHFFPWHLTPEYSADLGGVPFERTPEEKKLVISARNTVGPWISNEQLNWRRATKAQLGNAFEQEYPATAQEAFLTSGQRFFDLKKVMVLMEDAKQWAKANPYPEHTAKYTVFKQPVKGHEYAAGVDVAEGAGDGGDYSTIKIIDATAREEVFSYRAHVGIPEFYRDVDYWCRHYGNALLAVERNNHGHAVILGLNENCRYPNLYTTETSPGNAERFPKEKIGWETTAATKSPMLVQLKSALEGNPLEDSQTFSPEITFYDTSFLAEALTMVDEHGKLQAEVGKHDDLVMATGIAFRCYLKLRGATDRKAHGIFLGGKRVAA